MFDKVQMRFPQASPAPPSSSKKSIASSLKSSKKGKMDSNRKNKSVKKQPLFPAEMKDGSQARRNSGPPSLLRSTSNQSSCSSKEPVLDMRVGMLSRAESSKSTNTSNIATR